VFSFRSAAWLSVLVALSGIAILGQAGIGMAKSPAIDFPLLYEAAKLSNQAYDARSKIMREMSGKSVRVATPGQTDVQYFIIFDDRSRSQTISVRGTATDANWTLDENYRGVIDSRTGILMHEGFRDAALAIHADVKPRLKEGYTTYLAGHSLGGAVAAILGIYFQKDGVKLGGIHTFGQPKFTNVAGARAHENLPLLRVIYQNDTVPLLPDDDKQRNQVLAHIGPAFNIFQGPYYAYGTASETLMFSQDSFTTWLTQISIPDHEIKWYLQGLEDKLNGSTEVSFKDRNKYIVRHKYGTGTDTAPVKYQFNFNHHN